MIDVGKYKDALLRKQSDLDEQISTLSAEGREARVSEVEDPIDEVTSDEAQSAAFFTGSVLSDTRSAIDAALERIADGTYGQCVDCGRDIEEARLNAVPWTPYCLQDQEKHDRQNAAASEGDLLVSSS